MSNPHNIKAGDVLLIVPNDRRDEPYEATVIKVGRLYATLSGSGWGVGDRLDLGNMSVGHRDYTNRAMAYRDRAAWEAKKNLGAAMGELRRQLTGFGSSDVHPSVTAADVRAILTWLREGVKP